jgi:hypothetical protein
MEPLTMFEVKSGNGLFSQLIAGIAVVVIVLPVVTKGLTRGHINLNGIVLDLAETALEAITQRDWNFGDVERVDESWENAE